MSNNIIFIDGPEHFASWEDSTGQKWYLEWHGYCGPMFSRNNFTDGGVCINEVPKEILKSAEIWCKKVLGVAVRLTEPEFEEDIYD